MKGLAPAAAGLMLAAAVVVPAPSDATTTAPAYRHYAGCGVRDDTPPAHSCPKRGKKAAFFKSVNSHVHYDVCVRFPNDKRLCARAQDAPEGELRVNTITSHQVGKHIVTWFVDDERVGIWTFRVKAPA